MKKIQLIGYIRNDTQIFLTKPRDKKKYIRLVMNLDPIDIKEQVNKHFGRVK